MTGRFLLLIMYLLPAASMAGGMQVQELPSLPEGVSNNAVARLPGPGGITLLSMQGIAEGKTPADIHKKAWKSFVLPVRLPGNHKRRRWE